MTIIATRPNESVGYHMDFYKPSASGAEGRMEFKPGAGGTHITWTMDSKANLIMKAMGLFMSMDKVIGASLRRGLPVSTTFHA